ncbi:MAG: 50S ribosomal protein L22 [Armatimonadetes bacterium]|nr:50S ribosomal protein L22 [Armatimonadota bacterium]
MAKQTRARASYVLMSPRKVRLVLDLVRGKYVDEAVAILRGTPNRAARVVEKLVHSATANAENNMGLHRDGLKVGGCFADGGPTLKRIQPRAMGRAYRIIKRTSHVTVIVEEAEVRRARRLARTVTKADAASRRRSRAAQSGTVATAGAAAAKAEQEAPQTEAMTPSSEESVDTSAGASTEVQEAEATGSASSEVEVAQTDDAPQESAEGASDSAEDSPDSEPEESK